MRRWAGLVGVLVTVASMGGQAAAQAPVAEPAVAFVNAEPVVTSCSELAGKGLRIRIRNETGAVQRVRSTIELTRKNGRTVRPRSVCGGLKRAPRRRALGPGEGAILTLTGANPVRKGSFSGTLAIFGGRGRVDRLDLTISKKEETPVAGLAATPMVSSLSKDTDVNGKGPFWVPVKGSNADLPSPPKGESGVEPLTVGALTGPDDPVTVVYRGESESLPPGVAQVGLELEGPLSPGTYSGKADLAPEDPDKGEVTLSFEVSEPEWLAILVLFGGILLGIVLLRINGRTVPRARLLGRTAALGERYKEARSELLAAESSGTWNKLEIKDLHKQKGDLEKEIRKATRSWKVLVKIDKKVVDQIEAEIKSLEDGIDLLRKVPGHAQGLEGEVGRQKATRLPPPPDSETIPKEPIVERDADKLLAKDQISLAALQSRLDAMDAQAALVRRLRRLEGQLEEKWQRTTQLTKPNRWHPDPEGVEKVEGRLKRYRKDLWEAADEEALKKVGEKIERVDEELVPLEAKIGKGVPKAQEMVTFVHGPQGENVPVTLALTAPQASAALGDAVFQEPPPPPPPPTSPPAPEAPLLTEGEAKKVVLRAAGLQFVAVLVAAAVALATGLEALYVGNPWGTTWDIIFAVVWGIVAQATVTTLVTSLDDLGSLAALWKRG